MSKTKCVTPHKSVLSRVKVRHPKTLVPDFQAAQNGLIRSFTDTQCKSGTISYNIDVFAQTNRVNTHHVLITGPMTSN